MNLHSIVAGAISAVNPFISATRRRSTGYTTNAAGQRIPTFSNVPVTLQIQALTYTDLTHLDALNIQGMRRAVYMQGVAAGLVRVGQQGGDLIVFPSGTLSEGDVWLVAHILESWNDGSGNFAWVKYCITLQDGS
jgi:hypothetical protein